MDFNSSFILQCLLVIITVTDGKWDFSLWHCGTDLPRLLDTLILFQNL